jgi:hypothetical protein
VILEISHPLSVRARFIYENIQYGLFQQKMFHFDTPIERRRSCHPLLKIHFSLKYVKSVVPSPSLRYSIYHRHLSIAQLESIAYTSIREKKCLVLKILSVYSSIGRARSLYLRGSRFKSWWTDKIFNPIYLHDSRLT